MLVIGLTGGMGSGKTTVAELFAKQGAPIIDADLIAHTLTEKGKPAWKKMLSYFGPSFVKADQSLDRPKLR
ncbi:MAG TPA: dephospho-CoA kinase, partial [Gammaproteobacteria bacterium]|nr:dephospho-CoA kinase [Gammaproteobacteria bacterium]